MKKTITSLFFLLLFLSQSFAQDKKNGTFKEYLKLGNYYYDNNKIDSAKVYLHKIDSLFSGSKTDSSTYYKTAILRASILTKNNKSDSAIEILLQAKSFFKQEKDSANCGLVFYKLGIANYYVNRRGIAKGFFKKTLKFKKHLSKKLFTKSLQNVGTINLEIGILTKNTSLITQTITNYTKAIAIYKKEKWQTEEALATSLLSEAYKQLSNYKKALSLIDEAILLSKKIKNKSQEGFALIKKADYLNIQKRNFEALKVIEKPIKIFTKLKDKPTLLYAYTRKKKILFSLKKYKEATVIGDSIYSLSISIYNTRFADKVSEMDAKYQKAENQKKIALQKEELLAQKLSIKNRNLYAILLTSALLILGILSFGFYSKNKFKRKQLQKELNLKDALSQIKTQNKLQEQRLRISRDLHDNIGSQLTFIISSIDNLKFISKNANHQLKNKLSSISTFTADTIFQLRDTIWAMNKNQISSEDIHARILSYIEKAKIAVPKTVFTVDHSVEKILFFNSMVGVNLFRVMQESLNNAIKYADATKIDVFAYTKDKQLLITVKDNGKGFDLTTVKLSNGLSNMENRMSEIGGKITIDTKINKGTIIKISVPI